MRADGVKVFDPYWLFNCNDNNDIYDDLPPRRYDRLPIVSAISGAGVGAVADGVAGLVIGMAVGGVTGSLADLLLEDGNEW